MNIVFSGGGTGGHIYPALAMREILQTEFDFSAYYIGINGGLEEKLVSREKNITFLGVRAQGMPRKPCLKWLSFPFVNFLGIIDALRHLNAVKPQLVITTGGYVAFPVLAAARLSGIPAVLHEQNAAMGVTNRAFSSYASRILLTYESAANPDQKKIFLTGNPVRKEFLEKNVKSSRFSKKPGQTTLLAVGGSGGALSLNKACIELAQNWLPEHPEFSMIHISGERDFPMVQEATAAATSNYQLLPYLHEMKEAFDSADLMISRAGATILSEIAVCRKPAILVPYPHATDNHQEKNARVLEESGAAKLLLDRDLSGNTLAATIMNLTEKNRLETMAEAMGKSRPPDVEGRIMKHLKDLIQLNLD